MKFGLKELLIAGGPILIVLSALSVYSIALIWERWNAFRRTTESLANLLKKVDAAVKAGDIRKAVDLCRASKTPAGNVLEAAIMAPGSRIERLTHAESAVEYFSSGLKKRITVLATIGSTTPFIGLFGTVLGVMRAFRDLASYTGAGTSVVAAGISEALVNTAAGLFVAIPAIIAYNYFLSKATACSDELNWACGKIIAHTAYPEHSAQKSPEPSQVQ